MKLLISFIFFQSFITMPNNTVGTVRKNNMVVQWLFEKENICFKMEAPTKGWVAIGFNTKETLTGTNLIMGAVENDFYRVDDRYIIGPGNHKNTLEIGGKEAVSSIHGNEQNGTTSIFFTVPINAIDKYHQDLTKGKTIYLLMAYSMVDDFEHHSIMRTTIKITL